MIRNFSKENYSDLEKRVSEAFEDLLGCQHSTLACPLPINAKAEKAAHLKWSTLAKAEDSFLMQRSRIQWTTLGDANTVFYHRVIKARRDQNQIVFLMDDNDVIIDDLDAIKDHAVNFYQDMLGGSSVPSISTPQDIAALTPIKCDQASISLLEAPFTAQEIKQGFMSLPKNKAPGPDGYPGEFFTAHWDIVGAYMIHAVGEFLRTGQLLQQWNSTILTLVPKKPSACKLSDFRPIACCNSVYKVASKLLANRLKQVLPRLVSNAQSAFIPGRLLVENVLLATELVKGYNWKSISKRCMLKVDLHKAFDTLN